MLPSFLVIGAQKAGTTSLYRYLRAHPDVFMPETKELCFFSGHNWGRGREWYESQFAGADGAAAGEASPAYSMYPLHAGVAGRIAELIPDVRLVYLVRHPIRRMVSHYERRVVAGDETRPIAAALRENPIYLDTSRYALQLEQYRDHFPPEQLLVVRSEELRAERAVTLRRIFAFLGVDESFVAPEGEWNVSEEKLLRRPVVRRLLRRRRLKAAARSLPAPVRRVLKQRTHVRPPAVETALPAEVERELEEQLRADVGALRRYLGPDFDGWGIA